MKTTFVIPHKGRDELLRRTLASIAGQVAYTGEVEILVVTKESCLRMDPSLDTATGSAMPVHVHHAEQDLTIAAQRNIGGREGRGDHLAFIDADISLAADWLATMQHLLYAAEGRVIVSAVQRCSSAPTTLEIIRTDQTNMHVDVDLQHMPGSNLFMRREHFEATGGFPEHLSSCEDYFFTGQAASLGTLHKSSRTSFVHLGEDRFLAPMFVKEIWRGASNLQSTGGRSVGLNELPSFLVPVWTMLALLSSLVSLAGGFGAALALSMACFLAPVVLFSLRLRRRTRSSANMLDIIIFYGIYFTARGLGMLAGVGQILAKAAARVVSAR